MPTVCTDLYTDYVITLLWRSQRVQSTILTRLILIVMHSCFFIVPANETCSRQRIDLKISCQLNGNLKTQFSLLVITCSLLSSQSSKLELPLKTVNVPRPKLILTSYMSGQKAVGYVLSHVDCSTNISVSY